MVAVPKSREERKKETDTWKIVSKSILKLAEMLEPCIDQNHLSLEVAFLFTDDASRT